MAKEAKAVETTEVAPQQTVKAKTEEKKSNKPEWEIKERVYFLKGNKSPLTLKIPGRHTRKHALLYFDSCLLYTSPSPRDRQKSRMPSSA